MNYKLRNLFVVAFTLVLASCIGEVADPADNADVLGGNVATVTEQVDAIQASLADVKTIKEALDNVSDLHDVEDFKAQLDACISGIESHIASVQGGMSALNATLATMNLQAEIASVAGAIKASFGTSSELLDLEKGVKAWLGDKFENFYIASSEHASVKTMISLIEAQGLTIDALISDVEAGLRLGDADGSLSKIGAEVEETTKKLVALNQKLSSLCTELQSGYESVIRNSDSEAKKSLLALNENATSTLQEAGNSISTLSASLADSAVTIAELQERLAKVEADVEELLNKIQSLTFMSEYSSDYAIAYYEMSNEKVSAPGKSYDGKNKRTPVTTVDLNFMVRPAAAAAALTTDAVSIVGYYADQIETKAIDPNQFVNFEVQSVSVANLESGIITVKFTHDLKEDFYYKKTGAKCALFIATGKTDISSKFIELVPKDNSSTVYVESIRINTDDFEIDEGQSKNLTVTINPASATNKTVTWSSSNNEIATIDPATGVLNAEKQGNVTITATTNGIDEWGDNLTASVNVKVNPAIRLGGPLYVEVGKTAELSLDFPPAMNIESKVWLSSDAGKATVENGIVTGVAETYNTYTHEYNQVTITCIVNGNITLTHDMKVLVPQPRQIRFNNYADDVNSISIKIDETISLAATILPDNVDQNKFKFQYQSDAGLGWVNFDTGEIKEPRTPGGRYVYVDVVNKGSERYFVSSLRRTIIINVEPYYVQTMKFAQETISLTPNQTSVLVPVFTSDVEGKQPTYTELSWVSSNPSVVSVDPTTGEITTHKEGSAVITATTGANAVPNGQNAKSASCTIIVEEPVAPINIGDYFYSDGTWSSTRDYSKKVIGIVFSNTGAAMSDSKLMEDCPTATHGLVVGLTEYSSTLGQFGYSSVYGWLTSNGYPAPSTDVPNGYGLTKGMAAYRDANTSYVELYDRTSGPVAKHKESQPSGVSSWYIPSFKEMKWLHENKSTVNAALSEAGGTQITGDLYWSSTLRTYNSYNDCQGSPFDMINGQWYAYDKKTTSYPVRVVFAF